MWGGIEVPIIGEILIPKSESATRILYERRGSQIRQWGEKDGSLD